MTTSIAHTMRRYREAAGLSQDRAAQRANVHVRTLRKWEHGDSTPTVFDFIEWARAIELDSDQLAEVLGWSHAPE